jgi:dTMP kinase
VSDRFADSTRVYQGAARGDLRSFVDRLHDMAIGLEPDLTLVIDTEPATALARGLARRSGEDRFEELGAGFQARLRDGFLALAAEDSRRCRLIDGNREAEAVALDVRAAVAAVLP